MRGLWPARAMIAAAALLGRVSPAAAGDLQADSALAPAAGTRAAVYREAVVIGFNRSPRLALAPLKFADDDAVKLGAVLRHVCDDVTLLAELDDDTAKLYPTARPREPTRAQVLAAIEAAIGRLDRVAGSGRPGELILAYSGHGDVDPEGRGLVYLADGALTQRDLAAALGPALERHRVTLLVDACNAALLVGVRGAGAYGDRVPVGRDDPALSKLRQAGLILSTSGRAEVHEWELLLSGIFSYEVRSGLLGAADLDDDRQVTYAELAAFVAAANDRISNPIARLNPTIRGPGGDPDAVILQLDAAREAGMLRVPADLTGHVYLQDQELVRYADFHKTAERGFWLLLVGPGPLVLRAGSVEQEVQRAGEPQATLGPARPARTLGPRGQLHDYYERHLFEAPLDRAFAERFWAAAPAAQPPAELSVVETARLVMAPYLYPLAVSGGLVVLGGLGYGGGWLAHAGAQQAYWADETRLYNTLAAGLGIGGMTTAAVGALVAVGTAGVLGVEVMTWQLEEAP